MRRFCDTVHVRSGAIGDDEAAPVQFVWRGRLYVVRSVLSHWRERLAWWEQPAVAAVHGDGAGTAGTAPAPQRAGSVLEVGDLEREVWRVEAGVGRVSAVGVYDLARRAAPGTAAADGGGRGRGLVSEAAGTPGPGAGDGTTGDDEWVLLRVAD
ncbi:DUF6504 family protein [Kineococcus sp. SYSU DK004]|uniref:DUF6504 family protein n=1 Tax=Kineococcus sp. SYSU DK004 TaxID=3383125 RepID=UPI003D7CE4EC